MTRAETPRGVYLLTPDWTDTPRLLAATAAALAAGVRWLQYRNKAADAPTRRAQARALRELTLTHGAKFVVNDDVSLAIAVHADGVHVGRDDPDPLPRLAREGVSMTVGVSCYADPARARAAVAAGADYVAFGAVFASPTKPAAVRAPLALLAQARAAGMNVVAIGGIAAGNIAQVAAAGAHAAALITAVYDAADPGAAARELISKFKAGEHEHESQRTAV